MAEVITEAIALVHICGAVFTDKSDRPSPPNAIAHSTKMQITAEMPSRDDNTLNGAALLP